ALARRRPNSKGSERREGKLQLPACTVKARAPGVCVGWAQGEALEIRILSNNFYRRLYRIQEDLTLQQFHKRECDMTAPAVNCKTNLHPLVKRFYFFI
ncbi:unnamed protein product, partial [Gulo gulo]